MINSFIALVKQALRQKAIFAFREFIHHTVICKANSTNCIRKSFGILKKKNTKPHFPEIYDMDESCCWLEHQYRTKIMTIARTVQSKWSGQRPHENFNTVVSRFIDWAGWSEKAEARKRSRNRELKSLTFREMSPLQGQRIEMSFWLAWFVRFIST